MARRGNRPGRVTPKGTRPRNWSSGEPVSLQVRNDRSSQLELLDLLVMLSIEAVNLVPVDRLTGTPDMSQLEAALTGAVMAGKGDPETQRFAVVAEMCGSSSMAELVVGSAGPLTPAVVALTETLREATVVDAFEVLELFDEQRQYSVSVLFPTGDVLTAMIKVENMGGPFLSDGSVVPLTAADVRRVVGKEDELTIPALDAAEIGSRIRNVIAASENLVPPVETGTWPSHQVLIEWIAGLLPSNEEVGPADDDSAGTGWEPMTGPEKEATIAAFLASDERSPLAYSDDEVVDVVDSLLWFKDGYTNGDLYRWGPVQVAYLLEDWAPRKLAVGDAEFGRIPTVLRALVSWSLRRIDGIPESRISEVLSVIDQLEPDFRARSGASSDDVDLLLAAARAELGFTGDPDHDYGLMNVRWAAAAVGGEERLAALDAAPLPVGEQIDTGAVPAPYQSLVEHIAGHAASVAGDLYGGEYGTAAGRIAVRIGEVDPKALARGNPESAVAGIVWMAAAANGLGFSIVQAEINRAIGAKNSPKDRARTFTRILGGEFQEWRPLILGSALFLTGSQRQQLIDDNRAG